MKMNRDIRILWVIAALCLLCVPAIRAQQGTYQLSSPTGLEYIIVDNGTSPVLNTVQVNQLRNATGYLLTAATSGTVVTTCATNNLIFTAAAGTVTVDLPPSCEDGALFSLNNGTGSNFSGTITVATTDGSTIANGSTAVNLGTAGSQEWQYTIGSKVWYRLR